jgi:hypothetical protein
MTARDNQFMLLSLPSCGTDWVMSCLLGEKSPDYFREFFNPLANFQRYATLARAFGCELPQTIGLIARPVNMRREAVDAAYNITWRAENFLFTKENYSAFLVPYWQGKFQCVALYRPRNLTFPPNRLRVVNWYSCMFTSLNMNLASYPGMFQLAFHRQMVAVHTLADRCEAAHAFCFWRLLEDCEDFNIPVINYRSLLEAPNERRISMELLRLPGGFAQPGAETRVLETRTPIDRPVPGSPLGDHWRVSPDFFDRLREGLTAARAPERILNDLPERADALTPERR